MDIRIPLIKKKKAIIKKKIILTVYYDCSKNEVSEIVWFLKIIYQKKPTQLNYQLPHYYFNA
jgi:hypothetical protein